MPLESNRGRQGLPVVEEDKPLKIQPPDAENRMSGGVGALAGATPVKATRSSRIPKASCSWYETQRQRGNRHLARQSHFT
jgi:hypothetical protein